MSFQSHSNPPSLLIQNVILEILTEASATDRRLMKILMQLICTQREREGEGERELSELPQSARLSTVFGSNSETVCLSALSTVLLL